MTDLDWPFRAKRRYRHKQAKRRAELQGIRTRLKWQEWSSAQLHVENARLRRELEELRLAHAKLQYQRTTQP